jgi:hypothetical protein
MEKTTVMELHHPFGGFQKRFWRIEKLSLSLNSEYETDYNNSRG